MFRQNTIWLRHKTYEVLPTRKESLLKLNRTVFKQFVFVIYIANYALTQKCVISK